MVKGVWQIGAKLQKCFICPKIMNKKIGGTSTGTHQDAKT
jgi:hypothetical protein